MKPARNRIYERRWLYRAEQRTGLNTGWRARVVARLDWAQAKHGDRWAHQPPGHLLDELQAEAEDLGGWAVLLAQHLRAEDPEASPALNALLTAIAAKGTEVDDLIQQARTLLERRTGNVAGGTRHDMSRRQ